MKHNFEGLTGPGEKAAPGCPALQSFRVHCGDDMSFNTKISKSGIFKLNDKGEPIEIFKLRRTPETLPGGPKDLSKKHYYPLNKREIAGLIGDLSYEIDRMTSKPDTNAWFETMIFVYESELKMTLKMWKFSEAELNPQLSELTKKMRKVLRKKINGDNYPGITGPKSKRLKSAMWTDILMKVFEKYLHVTDNNGVTDEKQSGLNKVDALTYISHILKACDIEAGNIKTIFNRIKQSQFKKRTQISDTDKKMKKLTAAISRLK